MYRQRLIRAAGDVHAERRRVEEAVRPVEVAGADAQFVGVDVVADADALRAVRLDPPGRFVKLVEGQALRPCSLSRHRRRGGDGELLDMAGVLTDHVGAGRPDRQRDVERWAGDAVDIERDFIKMRMRMRHRDRVGGHKLSDILTTETQRTQREKHGFALWGETYSHRKRPFEGDTQPLG